MKLSQPVGALTACLIASQALAVPRIEQLAPEGTVVVASIENCDTLVHNVQATRLWQIWDAPELSEMRAKEQYKQAVKKLLQELGVEGEDLPMPSGAVGLAVFPVLNNDLGVNEPAFLLSADFGANADRAAQIIDAAVKKGEKEGDLEFDEKIVLGRTVVSLKIKQPAKPEPGADGADDDAMVPLDDEGNPMVGGGAMLDPQQWAKEFQELHYVRDGSNFMVSTSEQAISDALEVADGADHPSIAKNPEFQKIVARLGSSDGWGVILLQNVEKIFPAGEDAIMTAALSAAKSVIGEVTGLGMGIRFDAPKAMIQSTWFASMPSGKSGLTALLDTQTPRGDLPAFVGSDAVEYWRANFEFGGLMATIRSLIRSNELLQARVSEEELAQIEPTVQQITGALQPEMHHVATLTRPITLDSLSVLYAARCSQPEQINNLMAANAASLAMQPRDFLGQTIYSMDPDVVGMMVPPGAAPGLESGISLATGGGFVFVGATGSVEQALRSAGQGGAKREPDPIFRRVADVLPATDMVAWGYNNVVDQLEADSQLQKLHFKKILEEARQVDPEYAKELEQQMAGVKSSPLDDMDFGLLRRHMGPMAWMITAPDDGMLGTMYLLGPAE